MFHLFAGIQLVPDIASFGFNKEIIISKFNDYSLPEGAVSIKEQIPSRQQLFGTVWVENYDQLPYQSDLDFFVDVYNNDVNGIELYADRLGYATILCKFMKLIFPNKSAQTAYLEYKLSLDKFFVDYVYNRNIAIQHACYPIDKIRVEFEILSEQQFVELFEQTEVTFDDQKLKQFKDIIADQLSTEYHIATLLSGNNSFNQLLDRRIKNTILNVLASSVQEVNPFVTYNIYTGLYQFDNTVNQDIKQCINKLPVADLLNSVDVFNPINNDDYDRYNEDYERLARFLTDCNDFGWDKVDMAYARKCIKYLHRNYDIRDVITHMLNEHDVKIFLFSEIKNINPLLLFYIFDLYSKNDNSLNNFVIN